MFLKHCIEFFVWKFGLYIRFPGEIGTYIISTYLRYFCSFFFQKSIIERGILFWWYVINKNHLDYIKPLSRLTVVLLAKWQTFEYADIENSTIIGQDILNTPLFSPFTFFRMFWFFVWYILYHWTTFMNNSLVFETLMFFIWTEIHNRVIKLVT